MNVYEKLANVQASLKAPKGQYNSFGKYKYRSCEDIVESVKPLLKQNGLLLTMSDEIRNIDGRFYVSATATIIDIKDGTSVMATAYAREEETKKGMDGSQVTGASSSYARKYALNGLFAIDDNKDSDATNTGDEPKHETKQEVKQMSPRQKLIKKLNELNIDVNAYAKANNVNGKTDNETFERLLKELDNA